MWYKAEDDKLINLDLVTHIDKSGAKNKAYLVFYHQVFNSSGNEQYTKVEFPNSNARDTEYNKIFQSLKTNKVPVII